MSRNLNCPKCHGVGHVPADGYGRDDCPLCTQGADAPSPELLELAQRVLDQPEDTDTPEQWAGKVADSIYGTQDADARPVARNTAIDEVYADAAYLFHRVHQGTLSPDAAAKVIREKLASRDATPVVDARPVAITNEQCWKLFNAAKEGNAAFSKELDSFLATRDATPSGAQDAVKWRDAYEAEHKRVQRLEGILIRELGLAKAQEAIAATAPKDKT